MKCHACGQNLPEQEDAIIKQVIDHLNMTAMKKFKLVPATTRLIAARIKEGAILADFQFVNVNKTNQWQGTEFEVYIRPETLYSAKHFQSYLNEPRYSRRSQNRGDGHNDWQPSAADLEFLAKKRAASGVNQ